MQALRIVSHGTLQVSPKNASFYVHLQQGMGKEKKNGRITDGELSAKIRSGDIGAYREVFLRHYTAIYRFLCLILKDRDAAEDLAQETFLKLWIRREGLDPGKSLKSYLYTMSRNAALDYFRTHRKTTVELPSDSALAGNLSADGMTYFRQTSEQIERAVDGMPLQRQKVFRMSRYDQLSSAEIARELGISRRTVEKHLSLALEDIRKHLS